MSSPLDCSHFGYQTHKWVGNGVLPAPNVEFSWPPKDRRGERKGSSCQGREVTLKCGQSLKITFKVLVTGLSCHALFLAQTEVQQRLQEACVVYQEPT